MRTRAARDDAGETLAEVLMAVLILGLAAVAILAGVQLGVFGSDLGRKQATGGAYVRSLAEAIQNGAGAIGYQTCGGSNHYLSSSVLSQAGLPTGYTPAVTGVSAWTSSGWASCTSSNDQGVQRLDLTVTSPGTGSHQDVEKLSVIVRKACNGSLPSPC